MTKNPGVRRLDSPESSDGLWSPARAAVPGYAPEPGQIDELVVELAPFAGGAGDGFLGWFCVV